MKKLLSFLILFFLSTSMAMAQTTATMSTDGSGLFAIGTTSPSANLEIVESGSTPLMISSDPTGDGDFVIVNSVGCVGIGSTVPQSLLDVNGTVTATAFSGDGSSLTNIGTAGGWTDAGSDVYLVTGADNVGLNTTDPTASLEIVESGEHVFMVSDDATGDGDLFIITSDGNAGIGNNAPDGKLQVEGAINVTMEANAFSVISNFPALLIGASTGATADNGGLMAIGRRDKSNEPFSGLSGWDDGAWRALYFGGGGWSVPDANVMGFFTASAYNETNDNGLLSTIITNNGRLGVGVAGSLSTTEQNKVVGKFHVKSANGNEIPAIIQQLTGQSVDTLQIQDGSDNVISAIDVAFNWGIGTTAPLAELHIGDGDPDESVISGENDVYIADDLEVDGAIYGDGSQLTGILVNPLTADLDLNGFMLESTTNGIQFDSDDDATADVVILSNTNVGFGTLIPQALVEIDQQATSSHPFMISSDATSDGDLLFVQSDGNVGLGVTNPSVAFEVAGTTGILLQNNNQLAANGHLTLDIDNNSNETDRALIISHSNGTELMRVNEEGNVGIGTEIPQALIEIDQQAASDHPFMISSDATSDGDLLFVQSDGNVGVGTWEPSSQVHIYGADPVIEMEDTDAGNPATIRVNQGHLELTPSSSRQVKIMSEALLLQDSVELILGTGTSDTTWQYDGTDTLFNYVAGDWTISAGGTEAARFESSRNVGIGTTAPLATVHVGSGTPDHSWMFGGGSGDVYVADDLEVDGAIYLSDGTQLDDASDLGGGDIINEGDSSAEVIDSGSDGRIVITTDGTEIARFDAAGNFGLGTTIPQALVEIDQQAASDHPFMISSDATSDGDLLFVQSDGNIGINATTPMAPLEITNDDTAGGVHVITDGSGTAPALAVSTSSGDLTPIWLVRNTGDMIASRSVAGGSVFGRFINENNSNTASTAHLDIETGGASAGDPYIHFEIQSDTANWSMGIDNSDGDKFKVSNNASGVGTNDYIVAEPSSGNVGIGTWIPLSELHVGTGDPDEAIAADDAYIGGDLEVDGIIFLADGTQLDDSSDLGGSPDIITEGDTTAEVIDTGSDGRLVVTTDGTEVARFDAAGNVGIGSADPDERFTVQDAQSAGDVAIQVVNEGNSSDTVPTASLQFQTRYAASANVGDSARITVGRDDDYSAPANRDANMQFLVESSDSLVEAMRIDNTANVGIGSNAPSEKVDIEGSGVTRLVIEDTAGPGLARMVASGTDAFFGGGTSTATYIQSGAANAVYVSTGGRVGIFDEGPDAKLEVAADGVTPFMISDDDTGDGNFMIVTSVGNVGINTLTPLSELHIENEGPSTNIAAAANDNDGIILDSNTNNWINFISGSTTQSGLLMSDGTRGIGRIFYDHNDDSMDLFVNSATRASITSTGNFGIGSTVPLAHLHVGTGDPDESVITDTNDVYIADDLEVDGAIYGDGSQLTGILVNPMTADLDLNGFMIESTTDGIQFDSDDDATADVVILSNTNVGFGTLIPQALVEIDAQATTSHAFMISSDATSDGDYMVVDSAGNVGIGVEAPFGKFHFMNGDAAGLPAIAGGLIVEGSSTSGIAIHGSTTIDQIVLFGTTNDNTSAEVSWRDNISLFKMGTTHSGGEVAIISDADAEAARVDTAGNVGIGSTIPLAHLHVGTGDPDESVITDTNDVYIADDLEVDGAIYGDGSQLSGILGNPMSSDLDVAGFMIESTTDGIQFDADDDGTANIVFTSEGGMELTGVASLTTTNEGAIYYDTDDDQLKVYANGKWQADRTGATIIVAASNSQDAEKADRVCTGTNDDVCIENALSDLPAAGGTIVMLEGAYTIDASINFDNLDNVNLIGVGHGTVLERDFNSASDAGVIDLNTNNTNNTFAHFAIDGNDASFADVDNVSINVPSGNTDNLFYNLYLHDSDGEGILMTGADRNRIIGNVFRAIDHNNIQFNTSDSNTISDNVFEGGASNALFIGSSVDNTISNNVITNMTAEGIYLSSASTTNTLSNNNIQGAGTFGIRISSTNAANFNVIDGNIISDSTGVGIYVTLSHNNVISNNQIYESGDTSDDGIFLSASDNTLIIGNRIEDGTGGGTMYGINISNSTSDNTYIVGNYISGAGYNAEINDVGTGTIIQQKNQFEVHNDGSSPFMVSSDATGDGDFVIVTSVGNMGIRETVPVAALHVSDSSQQLIQVDTSNTASGTAALRINRAATNVEGAIFWATASDNKWALHTDNDSTEHMYMWNDSGDGFVQTWRYNSGNVGIGTTNPLAHFAVGDGDPDESEISGSDDMYVADDLEIDGTYYGDGSGLTGVPLTITADLEMGGWHIESSTNGILFDPDHDGTAEIVFDTNNRVGIGTDDPQSILDVYSLAGSPQIEVRIDDTSQLASVALIEDTNTGGFIQYRGSTNSTNPNTMRVGTNTAGAQTIFTYAAGSEGMRIDENGNVGVGTNNPQAGFEVVEDPIQALFGADDGADTTTDSTNKRMRIGMPHYDLGEEPTSLFFGSSDAAAASLAIGGGTGLMNAVESLHFYTAADNTTTTGTRWMSILNTGNVGVGSTDSDPDARMEVIAEEQAPFMISTDATADGDIMVVTSTGRVGLGEQSPDTPIEIRHATNAQVGFTEDGNAGGAIFYDGSNNLFKLTSGIGGPAGFDQRVAITRDTGLVGIGSTDTTPDAKLEVVSLDTTPFMVSSDATGDGDYMIVTSAGNVGVSSTAPQDLVDIAGDIAISGAINRNINFRTGSNSASSLDIEFPDVTSNTVGFRLFRSTNTTSGGYFTIFRANNSGDAQTTLQSYANSFINALTGNVGIGTNLPLAELHVGTGDPDEAISTDDAYIGGDLEVDGIIFLADGTQLDDSSDLGGSADIITEGDTTAEVIDSGSDGRLVITTDGTEIARFDTAGNLGMSDTDPDAILDISLSAGTNHPFMISSDDTADGDYLTVTSVGNVGIGTTTSASILTISKSGTIGGVTGNPNDSYIRLNREDATERTYIDTNEYYVDAGGGFTFGTISNYNTAGSKDVQMVVDEIAAIYVDARSDGGNVGISSTDTTADAKLEVVSLEKTPFMISSDATADGDMLVVESNGNIGVGTANPFSAFDIYTASNVPQLRLYDIVTDAAVKDGWLTVHGHSNAEEPLGVIKGRTNSATLSYVDIGGDSVVSGVVNAATEIRLLTAATSTTVDGTIRMVVASDGNVGIGTTTADTVLEVNNAITYSEEYNAGSVSGAFTVNWNNGNKQRVTITGANLDITFADVNEGVANYLLRIIQGDGADTIDWTNETSIKWPGGTAPTLSTGSGDIDIVSCYYSGGSDDSYYCSASLDFQ